MYVHEESVKNAVLLKNSVTYVHLKDVTANTSQMTLLGEGDISVKEVLNVFPKDSNTAIEYPCGSKPLEVLKGEIAKLVEIKLEIENALK